MLGDGQRDAGDIRFLEGIGSQHRLGHLSRDADDRNRVHHRRGNAGDQVGGARPRRGDGHADPAACARVTIGHVRGALFVAHQHVANRVIEQRIVGRKNSAARVPEDGVHALFHQARPDDVSSTLFHKGIPSVCCSKAAISDSCARIRSISSLPSSSRCREASSNVKRSASPCASRTSQRSRSMISS